MENDRSLFGNGSGNSDYGPIVVLIVVCVIFFMLWIPMFCSETCPLTRFYQRNRQRQAEAQAEIIRASLLNINFLGLGDALSGTNARRWNPLRSMSPADRRAYIDNVLVSKKIMQVVREEHTKNKGEDSEMENDCDSISKPTTKKCMLVLTDVADAKCTSKYVCSEPCAICLTEYEEGEVMCWSQNSRCAHTFHKECAVQWLLRNEECPLCRHNYLSFGDEDEETSIDRQTEDTETRNDSATLPRTMNGNTTTINNNNSELTDAMSRSLSAILGGPHDDTDNTQSSNAQEFMRGVRLFYVLSRLQSLADTRPNTTIRLEDVELANGRRGNLEIRRGTDGEMGEPTASGLNVSVSDQNETPPTQSRSNASNGEAQGETLVRQAIVVDDGTPDVPLQLQLPVTWEQPHSSMRLGTQGEDNSQRSLPDDDADDVEEIRIGTEQ